MRAQKQAGIFVDVLYMRYFGGGVEALYCAGVFLRGGVGGAERAVSVGAAYSSSSDIFFAGGVVFRDTYAAVEFSGTVGDLVDE